MHPKMIWANLAVDDLKRTAEFYSKLGFRPNGPKHFTEDLVSFLFGENDFVIHFFRKEKLQQSMSDRLADPGNGSEIMFSMSAKSRQEVDEWTELAVTAGARIFREPGEDENGFYYSVFADPDGHKFNLLSVEGM